MRNEEKRLAVEQRIQTCGVIVLVPGDMDADRATVVADALLASPIEGVEIVDVGPGSLEVAKIFHERANGHMLVGIGRIEDEDALLAVIEAGIDFASSAGDFRIKLIGLAKQHDFCYIPSIHSGAQAMMAERAEFLTQKLRDDIDVDGLETIRERAPRPFIMANQVKVEWIESCLESNLRTVFVNDVYVGDHQSQRNIIERARVARNEWLANQ